MSDHILGISSSRSEANDFISFFPAVFGSNYCSGEFHSENGRGAGGWRVGAGALEEVEAVEGEGADFDQDAVGGGSRSRVVGIEEEGICASGAILFWRLLEMSFLEKMGGPAYCSHCFGDGGCHC